MNRKAPRLSTAGTVLAFVAGAGLSAVAAPSSAGASPSSPAALLAAALTAARSEPGGNWVSTSTGNGFSLVERTKVARDAGVQTITARTAGHTGQIKAVLTGGSAYFKADDFGLQVFDFSTSAAKAEAGKWISLRPSVTSQAAEYQVVAAGLTVASTVTEIALTGPLSETTPTSVAGVAVVGIKGDAPSVGSMPAGTTEVLYVRTSGTPLPVKAVQTYHGDSSTVVFSHWGSVPAVPKPASSVPFEPGWLKPAT